MQFPSQEQFYDFMHTTRDCVIKFLYFIHPNKFIQMES